MQKQDSYKLTYAFIIFILISDLFFTYLIKYTNQDLQISEFKLFVPGNLFNLFFTLLAITGILFLVFRKENKNDTKIIVSLTITVNIFLILSAIISFIKIPMPDYYFYDYHISRIIIGLSLFLYQFLQLVFISAVWLFVLGYHQLLFLRSFINSIFIFVLLFMFSVFYLNLNNRDSGITNINRNNIGVVLGAAVWSNRPSPSLSTRADKAAMLLSEGKISRIQLTGSNAPGELTEAEMAYNYLKTQKIDMTKVDVETKTTSTNEQIKFIKNTLYNKPAVGNVIIISDKYHLSRIKDICRFHNMDVKVASSDLMHQFKDNLYYNLREAAAIIIFWLFAL